MVFANHRCFYVSLPIPSSVKSIKAFLKSSCFVQYSGVISVKPVHLILSGYLFCSQRTRKEIRERRKPYKSRN